MTATRRTSQKFTRKALGFPFPFWNDYLPSQDLLPRSIAERCNCIASSAIAIRCCLSASYVVCHLSVVCNASVV